LLDKKREPLAPVSFAGQKFVRVIHKAIFSSLHDFTEPLGTTKID